MTEPEARTAPSAAESSGRAPTAGHRLQFAALKGVASVLGLLGIDRASALMGWLWRRLAPLNRRHRRAEAHLALALPDLTAAERRAILGDMWENLGRTAAETFLLPRIIAEPDRFVMPSADRLADLAQGSGIFASLHQGNWELAAWGMRLAGMKVAAVYRPLRNPLADAFLRALRLPVYDAGLFPREAASAFRLRTLARRGVCIGMVADLRDPNGVEVPFFGQPATANPLPAVLARRLGLPLVAGRVVRTGGARFRVEIARVTVPVTADVEADVAAAAAALTARFEAWIREDPGQWMWAHRKWTAPVPGP